MSIDVLRNIDKAQLPWTFRLPYRGGKKEVNEPTQSSLAIDHLTKVEFGIVGLEKSSPFVMGFKEQSHIIFRESNKSDLTLEFDNGRQGKFFEISSLDLILKY